MRKSGLFFGMFLAVCFLVSGFVPPNQQGTTTKKAAPVTGSFSGLWSGGEKCKGVSAPTAILNIRQRSAQEVVVNGIYSTQGDVKAQIVSNTLVIPMQEVTDPQFVNFFIGGKLTLSANGKSLRGSFAVRNNELPDTCDALYFRK